jgi:antirestriction protein ArdC
MHPVDRTHREVAQTIIEMIEQDGLKWTKKWATPSPACNGVTGRAYSGSNILTTGIAMMCLGTDDPRFVTFKQALDLGGAVRKGEKSIPIISFNVREKEQDDGTTRRFASGFVHRLFHVSQCDNLDPEKLAPIIKLPPPSDALRNAAIEAFVAAYCQRTGIQIEKANAAFYTRAHDKIGMPPIETFFSDADATGVEHYYSTLLHEMVHSTGIEARLNRACYIRYHVDRTERAREELIAEIGSVFLGQHLGLQAQPRQDNAAYLKSWVDILSDRPKAIFDAAAAAQAAMSFIIPTIQSKEEAA